jgi:cytochrome c551/c552
MSSSRDAATAVAGLLLALCTGLAAAQGVAGFAGIGRPATEREVKAWDIDVRPDFKGLPAGSGSVRKGQQVWESKCASCHGVFGESTQVFQPLVGGTTAQDMASGRVARLLDPAYPARTTMMKLASLSTLWDYINRAMPWTEPKSLSTEEVYAVTGYMLHLAGVLPADFTLSDQNMGQAQSMLPNRNGMSQAHALWPGKGLAGQRAKPDVQGLACLTDCASEPRLASSLPDYARDAHGNLAEQNRWVGPQRGADTRRSQPTMAVRNADPAQSASAPGLADDSRGVQAQLQRHGCTACHAAASRLVGPSWAEIGARHASNPDYLTGKIRSGGAGQWGPVPMPPQSLGEVDAKSIAAWLASGAVR